MNKQSRVGSTVESEVELLQKNPDLKIVGFFFLEKSSAKMSEAMGLLRLDVRAKNVSSRLTALASSSEDNFVGWLAYWKRIALL